MSQPSLPDPLRLESLEVGAAPLVRRFLDRLALPALLEQHLPALPGRRPDTPSSSVLCLLLANLLIDRRPLYAIPAWAARRVPGHLGLGPGQAARLNDDRIGRALDHLARADRASLLTALVVRAVREFRIDMSEMHQDTTTVTFSGEYAGQEPAEQADRPARITFGYNKDHRPDLKQLLLGITISDDGAVPVHCRIHDGNTADDQARIGTWDSLRGIIGHSGFLHVADSKLCTRENMAHIASRQGRFLTVMPRTRGEDAWFRQHAQSSPIEWQEVHREPDPRRRDGPDTVYQGIESPSRSSEGYRVLWYASSQKRQRDRECRQRKLERARARLQALDDAGRTFDSEEKALEAARRIIQDEEAGRWLSPGSEAAVEEEYRQSRPGRPGPGTEYRRVERKRWKARLAEDGEAVKRDACCDGMFPLMTNDDKLEVREALLKYKYQPFVEKRHEQLKSVFGVAPMWLKSAGRVESLLWLYFVVELVQALVEREVRRRMEAEGLASLALYPEGRASAVPTAELVINALEGHRRHRLLDEQGQELRRFHDPLSDAAQEALRLLGVDLAPYGLP